MFANSQAGGIDISPLDICGTPPLCNPTIYFNFALGGCGTPNVPHILYSGGPVHNLATIIPFTILDEGGSCGGIISGTVMGLSFHVVGANIFVVHGAPITRLTSINLPNTVNTFGFRLVPSQTLILML